VVNCPTKIKPNWRAKRYGFLCGEKEAPITRYSSEPVLQHSSTNAYLV